MLDQPELKQWDKDNNCVDKVVNQKFLVNFLSKSLDDF